MPPIELLIWSAHAGALGMLMVFCVVVASLHRTVTSTQYLVWLGVCVLHDVTINGFLSVMLPQLPADGMRLLRVLSGPVTVAGAALGLRHWLDGRKRHAAINGSLMVLAVLCTVSGALYCVLPDDPSVAMAAGTTWVGCMTIALICAWAGMLGDSLARVMGMATLAMLCMLTGKYSLAFGYLEGQAHFIWVALTSAGSLTAISILVLLRSHQSYEGEHAHLLNSERDPATKLYNGKTLIQLIAQAQSRMRIRSGEGAVVAVYITDIPALTHLIGQGGVHEVLIRAAARVRQQAGFINPVGRYFDRCFMVVLETVPDAHTVQEFQQTVTRALKRPFPMLGLHGELQAITLKVGVGSAPFFYHSDVSSLLHKAEQSALVSLGEIIA